MERSVTAAGFLLGAMLTVAGAAAGQELPARVEKAAPTFNRDVGPILMRRCVECHRPNQIAPMSLLSYQDVRPWARAIKSKVKAREMPPWFADPRFGKFKNDASLPQTEIDTIAAWVDAGTPQGEGSAPTPPAFSKSGWSHPSGRDPDMVIELPVDWKVPAEGESPIFYLYAPMPVKEAKLFEVDQMLAGNLAVVHHMGVDAVNLPPGMKLGTGPAWPGGPITSNVLVPDEAAAKVDKKPGAAEDDSAAENVDGGQSGWLGTYIPGQGPRLPLPGVAKVFPGDHYKYLRWNLHFTSTGRPETVRPSLGLWWGNGPVTNVEWSSKFTDAIAEGQPLVAGGAGKVRQLNQLLEPIPPNDPTWVVTAVSAIRDDITLHQIRVHMHLRGRSMTYVLTYPDGREDVLLHVPKYDFNWQIRFDLATPLKVPAGSTIKAISRFDNSASNRYNPAPDKEVYWSEQSWDEMFLPGFAYTIDRLEKQPQASARGR